MQTKNKKNIIKHRNVSFYNNDQPDITGWKKRMLQLDKGDGGKAPMPPPYSVLEKKKSRICLEVI